jgi:hypothetical protein
MQLDSSTHIPDGFLAAMTPLSEKPCLGFERNNPAPHPGHNLPNSTAAIGLSWSLASETRLSHVMGRFLSPDWADKPEAVPYSDLMNPQSLNLYSYVKNNPLSQVDKDGHGCPPDCTDEINFVMGAANAFGSDYLLGAGRVNQMTSAGQLGAAVGDFGAAVAGGAETLAGAGGEVGGFALDATGVGAAIGVPANVVSAGAIVQGAAAATMGVTNLMKDSSSSDVVTSSGQKADQYGNKLGGSGKPQQHETQSNTREASNNKSLNEGNKSVNHSNPKSGQPHTHAADADGNKKPNSTHHNYPD